MDKGEDKNVGKFEIRWRCGEVEKKCTFIKKSYTIESTKEKSFAER